MMLDPHEAERLCKLLGKLGSDSNNERAVAGRLADEFIKCLGLGGPTLSCRAEFT
jgi:hypothetical protein